jgi:CubicO group peptidase (beta-lactamase class C family)
MTQPRTVEAPTAEPVVHGHVDDGYGPVHDVFAENLRLRGDVGAACAVYVRGRLVVDLWGGIADRRSGRPWEADTSAVIFSCSKGLVALCAYLLVEGGLLDLDLPIATWWPAFAAHGKEAVTLRDALSHRAGLAALDADLTRADVLAWTPVVDAIEAQAPLFRPADGHVYHAMTYGWLVGEVIRRVTGVTPGEFLHATLVAPLGLRAWIGLPADARSTVAWMEPPLPDEDSPIAREAARVAGESSLVERSLTMGGAFAFPADDGVVTFNDPEIQAGEIPAANGIATPRSLARLYAGCVSPIDGPPLLSQASLADALTERAAGPQLSGMPDDGTRWGTGFQLASPPAQPMLGPGSFGHAGAGGQLAFGDLEHEVGFAALGNQMGGYGDARARELTAALRRVLRA